MLGIIIIFCFVLFHNISFYFILFYLIIDCRCNGNADAYGQGGKCTDGKKGRWCYVNEHSCDKKDKYDGKFFSTTPCETEPNPNKPCVCNGKSDILGLGGSCEDGGTFCYVDKDANCKDIITHNGKTTSKNACKSNMGKLL